jgi:hypothetical protein
MIEPIEEMARSERRRLGTLGGALLVIGALAAAPAAAFIDPAPDAVEYLIILAGVAAGFALMVIPWERLPERSLYAVSVVATGYVMIGTGLYSDDFAFYQVLIAVYTAYVVRDRRDFLVLMFFFTATIIVPLAYSDDTFTEQMHHILVTIPVMIISAAVVRYLRDALAHRELQYRRFAVEAVTLAERIRGGPANPQAANAENVEERLADLASETRS